MRWKSHVRFGGRAEETDSPRGGHRASVRSHWATKALGEVRREVWNAARKNGQHAVAKELKNARYALWKNPGDLTARQEAKLASIAQTNQAHFRAYLLKSSSARCSPSKEPSASPCSTPG